MVIGAKPSILLYTCRTDLHRRFYPTTKPITAPSTSSVNHPPLVDTVRNLEHLLGDLRLQDTTSEAPATDTATGAASSSFILSFEGGKE